MDNFKFAKGFFTGMLVTDVIITTGLLFLTWDVFKTRKDYNRPLSRYGRYDSYAEYRKHERNKEFL